jgi:predicted nucleotide-binding protein (sugar kinase/HSP70/actin superfamily)
MNTACAAGTGSFLEEQASKLQVDIKNDFSDLALESQCPAWLGERCTVFMESDLVHYQQQGARLRDLTAGLAYAVVENYLKRVVGNRLIGENVFFQGGVAWNDSVIAAFRAVTGRTITVPPHHDVIGAVGAAILAMEEMDSRSKENHNNGHGRTQFRGFGQGRGDYETTSFVCQGCPNACEINRIAVDGQAPVFYGSRCGRYDRQESFDGRDLPDLFAERQALLMGDYAPPVEKKERLRIGIPRTLHFYDLFPYWRTFFGELDMDVVLSEPTNPQIAHYTKECAVLEACYPAKLVYGHVIDLLKRPPEAAQSADLLFLPSILDRENTQPGQVENKYCPYIPAMPYLVSELAEKERVRVLRFPYHMQRSAVKKENLKGLAAELGVSHRAILRADQAAMEAQASFYGALRRRGREIAGWLKSRAANGQGITAAVVVGRPYNTCDLSINLNLPYKLRKLGVLAIPLDCLPLDTADISVDHPNMYWRSGQDILAGAALVRHNPRLQAIFVSSFLCGPDSFLVSYFRRMMRGKPYLELEIDDHTADAGLVTRCEAFFESLAMNQPRQRNTYEPEWEDVLHPPYERSLSGISSRVPG